VISSGTNSQRARKEQEKGSGFDGDSWRDYHGDSTVYIVGKHGLSVHLPCDGKPGEKDRGDDSSENEDSGGLGSDYERNND